ncbi:unnamed protein product [Aphanomyces euteiches]
MEFEQDLIGVDLYNAAGLGHFSTVKKLLNEGAPVNWRYEVEEGATPLILAAQNGFADVVKELLAHGADINQTMKAGATALNMASERGHLDVVKELLAHGAAVDKATLVKFSFSLTFITSD